MIIEQEKENNKELCKDQMKRIYESIKANSKLKNHINFDRTKRIQYIQNYPYNNIPFNDNFLFNNICTFNDLSCVNGYFYVNDRVKIIDFNGNFKIKEKINISQRCVLPERIFLEKYGYKNYIPPLKKEILNEYMKK